MKAIRYLIMMVFGFFAIIFLITTIKSIVDKQYVATVFSSVITFGLFIATKKIYPRKEVNADIKENENGASAQLQSLIGSKPNSTKKLGMFERKKNLEIYRAEFAKKSSDRVITDAEWEELNQLQKQLRLSDTDISAEFSEFIRLKHIEAVDTGKMPLEIIDAPGITLLHGEIVHHHENASELQEKVTKREYRGGSQGMSFRIAKGITYRIGSQRGQLHTETGIVPISYGDFFVTSRRLIYRSMKKSFNYKYEQIESLELYGNGLIIGAPKGKMHTIRFSQYGDAELVATVINVAIRNISKSVGTISEA